MKVLRIHIVFFKLAYNGLFFNLFLSCLQYNSVDNVHKILADVGVRTMDLWCRMWLLCQLRHHHSQEFTKLSYLQNRTVKCFFSRANLSWKEAFGSISFQVCMVFILLLTITFNWFLINYYQCLKGGVIPQDQTTFSDAKLHHKLVASSGIFLPQGQVSPPTKRFEQKFKVPLGFIFSFEIF